LTIAILGQSAIMILVREITNEIAKQPEQKKKKKKKKKEMLDK
jgi:hypothetical protein